MSDAMDTYQQMQLAAIGAAKAGDLTQSLALFDRLLELQPDSYQAWGNRANVLDDLGRAVEAIASYDRALDLHPDYEAARLNRSVVQQKMANEAFNQGVVLDRNKELEAALVCYERALSIDPMHRAANLNAALVLEELGRLDEAVARLIDSERMEPGYVDGLNRAGDILGTGLGRHKEALECYQRSLAINPSQRGMRWNTSHSFLALGQYAQGWQAYDYRSPNSHDNLGWIDFPQAQWRGEPIAGKRILLWCEQGFGDVFQFCRYVRLVRDLGATVFLLVHPMVERLFQTVFAQEGITIVLGSAQAKPFDFQCPLLGLPFACKTDSLEKIPNQHPYLFADVAGAQDWHQRLSTMGGARTRRVGLVWAGGYRPQHPSAHGMDLVRSLHLRELASLEAVQAAQGIQFFSLQLDEPAKQLTKLQSEGWSGPSIIDLTKDLKDWADTAALIANLDLVISCDTAVAHLAAAMGKPTWILSRYNGCWRWLQDRDDSPWYPTVRLFRQTEAGDWADVVNRVAHALEALVD
jgi:Tetratricopeptide repeat/Glycosyltransferase family 9 (heptosyltransferase)